jgi:hypothetical protein
MKTIFGMLFALALGLADERAALAQSCTGCGYSACCIDPSISECARDIGLSCHNAVASFCGTNDPVLSSCGNPITCTCAAGTTCMQVNGYGICCGPGAEPSYLPSSGDYTCCGPSNKCGDSAHQCGTFNDSCGVSQNCGGCPSGQICTGNTCCQPLTCAGKCGTFADGCGGTRQCGATCGKGEACGTNNVCYNAETIPASTGSSNATLIPLLALGGAFAIGKRRRRA